MVLIYYYLTNTLYNTSSKMVINDNHLIKLNIVTFVMRGISCTLIFKGKVIHVNLLSPLCDLRTLVCDLRTMKHFCLLQIEHMPLWLACSFMNSNATVCLLVRTMIKCYRKHNSITLMFCALPVNPLLILRYTHCCVLLNERPVRTALR